MVQIAFYHMIPKSFSDMFRSVLLNVFTHRHSPTWTQGKQGVCNEKHGLQGAASCMWGQQSPPASLLWPLLAVGHGTSMSSACRRIFERTLLWGLNDGIVEVLNTAPLVQLPICKYWCHVPYNIPFHSVSVSSQHDRHSLLFLYGRVLTSLIRIQWAKHLALPTHSLFKDPSTYSHTASFKARKPHREGVTNTPIRVIRKPKPKRLGNLPSVTPEPVFETRKTSLKYSLFTTVEPTGNRIEHGNSRLPFSLSFPGLLSSWALFHLCAINTNILPEDKMVLSTSHQRHS